MGKSTCPGIHITSLQVGLVGFVSRQEFPEINKKIKYSRAGPSGPARPRLGGPRGPSGPLGALGKLTGGSEYSKTFCKNQLQIMQKQRFYSKQRFC